MAPVHAGMIRYESLINGDVDLADVALCYDSLIVRMDNEDIIREREERNRG